MSSLFGLIFGEAKAEVKQTIVNKYGIDIYNKIENSVDQKCSAIIDSSNTLVLKGLKNTKGVSIKQSAVGKNICALTAAVSAMQQANIDQKIINDAMATAVSKGGVFPANSSTQTTAINDVSAKLGLDTVNKIRASCVNVAITGGNKIDAGNWDNVTDVQINQSTDVYNKCLIDSAGKAANTAGVEIESLNRLRGESEATAGGLFDFIADIFKSLFGSVALGATVCIIAFVIICIVSMTLSGFIVYSRK